MMQILTRQIEFTTPWFEIVAKRTTGDKAPYYALRMQDYVTVVALTNQNDLILVRQFRPAVERYTLELPSGHVEKGETPADAARRELAEECGFGVPKVELLGALLSDTGRNENRLWCCFAPAASPLGSDHIPETGLERILVPMAKLPELIANAEFDHALNLAALMMVAVKYGHELLALK